MNYANEPVVNILLQRICGTGIIFLRKPDDYLDWEVFRCGGCGIWPFFYFFFKKRGRHKWAPFVCIDLLAFNFGSVSRSMIFSPPNDWKLSICVSTSCSSFGYFDIFKKKKLQLQDEFISEKIHWNKSRAVFHQKVIQIYRPPITTSETTREYWQSICIH